MTSEEKVKQVYPDAFAERNPHRRDGKWTIRLQRYVLLSAQCRTESWAWADALQRIQQSPVVAQEAPCQSK